MIGTGKFSSMRDVVAEIKAKMDIVDLVSEYVTLKKSGRYFRGLSPFKPEKTPSFFVSPDKGIAYCFSTNRGGDIFKFLQEVENVDFAEALKILAEKTGVELDKKSVQAAPGKKGDKQHQLEIHEEVTKLYEQKLWETEDGKKVLEYLHKRGLNDETIKKFRLGYAPDSFDATYLHLMKKDFTEKQILSAGLALSKQTGGGKIYDRFRGRLMFPITDNLGRIVGFGGRALAKDQQPKYLNSPETVIYQKSNLLYGYSLTKQDIKMAGTVLVVEGYMDVLAAWQNGARNVVAVNGTALTARQLTTLKSHTKTLILGFDMDEAGQEAALRAFELAQDYEFVVNMLELPDAKDIAEYCQEHGSELTQMLASAKLYTDFYYQSLKSKYDLSSLTERKKAIADFAQFFMKLHSSLDRDEYIGRIALDLGVSRQVVVDEINSRKVSKTSSQKNEEKADELVHKFTPIEKLMGVMAEFPEVFLKTKIDLGQDVFPENLKSVYLAVVDYYNQSSNRDCDFYEVLAKTDEDLSAQVKILSLYAKKQYDDLAEEHLAKEIQDLVNYLHTDDRRRLQQRLHRELVEAERKGDSDEVKKILTELSSLHK